MPTKFRPSETRFNRETKKKTVVHHYMKTQSEKVLRDCVAATNTSPKLKARVNNELVRRGLAV